MAFFFFSSLVTSRTAVRAGRLRTPAMFICNAAPYVRAPPPVKATLPLQEQDVLVNKQDTLPDIYDCTEEEIARHLEERLGQPKYRSKQIYKWLYERGASSFEEMNDLPKKLREDLQRTFSLGCIQLALEQKSKDGTIKRAYRLKDNSLVESVLMPYEDGRRTACISSQCGCAMGCSFCATGQSGFVRQLTASEIFQQALYFSRDLIRQGQRLSNVVFMGEGEPLNNRKNVFLALRRLNQDLGIGARSITISTVGLAPRIRELAHEDMQIKLAVSLHAASDEIRSALMPVNKRFPLRELMEACQYYVQTKGRRITFEWALISGQNDSPATANQLGRLLTPLKGKCHVNVINVNPTNGFEGRPADRLSMDRFLSILNNDWGIPATMRLRRGIDIDGGCGMLKNHLVQKKEIL